jgi:DNA ligase-1
VRAFADLLERLVLTPSRNGKLKLLTDYFQEVPDPDRGYAVSAITRDLKLRSVKPAMLRGLISERMDEILFAYSYDYVGDLAETIALAWPEDRSSGGVAVPALSEVVSRLSEVSRANAPRLIENLLDDLDPSARYALLKLVTGGLRIGISSRLAKQALASFGNVDITEIEEIWHGLAPPYVELFAWLEGKAERPAISLAAPFRSVMLAHPAAERDLENITPKEFAAEWKWDGIRVQAAAEGSARRLYSRTGDDISASFPDILDALEFEGALDGELLVARPSPSREVEIGTFGDLQQRLNRKSVSRKLLEDFPAFIRFYDILRDGQEDLRSSEFRKRRNRLEEIAASFDSGRFDVSPLVPFAGIGDIGEMRNAPPHPVIEGVMLKRWDSAYVAGRPKGEWFKWKRDPFNVDAVLMYAQRGHGKRSGYYSDYTFGVWREADDVRELVPVGKAYFGFTDQELMQIDKFVRENTIDRFGPVRAVRAEPGHGLVAELAFEGLNRSTRHKSGIAMRFPRISRLRWDKLPDEADHLDTLIALID